MGMYRLGASRMKRSSHTIDHATLEREARKLCESERGAGAWGKPRCQHNHWRKRVVCLRYMAAKRATGRVGAFLSVLAGES